mgnify:CR=1 FL=1
MKKLMGKIDVPALASALLLVAASALQAGQRPPGGGHFSVAEPAAIVLLGAGLVSLGFYVKKKRDKKK